MQLHKSSLLFALSVAGAAAFVWLTSSRLPAMVASHFSGTGVANGFMPHAFYVRFMLAFVVGLPALMVVVTWLAIAGPKARINLPDKDYWLAPGRRAETLAYLRSSILWFGIMLLVFLCYAHWLVVQANEAQPARLDNAWFTGGLLIFFIALLIWSKLLLAHFRRSS